jgi:large subunit ribosomal protein L13
VGTFFQTKEDGDKNRKWLAVDATDVPLGRLASQVAILLRGKHKTTYTQHVDGGDFVVVLNASKVKLTGKKLDQKVYRSHTGYPGGVTEINAQKLLAKHPDRVIQAAVQGMLPKGSLGRKMVAKLKVYGGAEHPHGAQVPEKFVLENKKAKK